jgi:hypothetical protein
MDFGQRLIAKFRFNPSTSGKQDREPIADTLGNFYKNPWTANLGIPEAIEEPSDNPVSLSPRNDALPVSVRSDSLAERSEFELPVPVSKLSDDSVVL